MRKNQEISSHDSYQTGSTKPPKSYQGLVAVLLILVIFLGGIISGLSMMNVRLFRMLEEQINATEGGYLRFSEENGLQQASYDGLALPSLGLTGQEVTELCRSYYGWPEGLYVSKVFSSGPAAKADLRQGDILLTLDGVPVVREQDLSYLVSQKVPGDVLRLTVYRKGCRITIPVKIE